MGAFANPAATMARTPKISRGLGTSWDCQASSGCNRRAGSVRMDDLLRQYRTAEISAKKRSKAAENSIVLPLMCFQDRRHVLGNRRHSPRPICEAARDHRLEPCRF